MRYFLGLVLAAASLLALPGPAGAAPTIGIAENQPKLFGDPLFQALKVKHARLVVSYDVVSRGEDELQRVTEYVNAAQAAGIQPLVTFEHSRGGAEVCGNRANAGLRQCRLPSAAEYEQNVRLFLSRFPYVRTIAPFNEINHFTQPTYRNPKAAARFTDIVRRNCRKCKIVVADILDRADRAAAKRPTYKSTLRYIKKFRRALKTKRRICGIHNYSDVNRFRDTGTRAIIKALGCKEIWLTETGGIFAFDVFRPSESRQLKATKYMFKLARRNRRIKRLYVYTWFGNVTPRFDAGLVADGSARPSYAEVKKRVR